MRQQIVSLLFLQTELSPQKSVPFESTKRDVCYYPAQIPLNKATIFSQVKYRLSETLHTEEYKDKQLFNSEHLIGNLSHSYQTWNNCGPASLSMLLGAFDIRASQEEIRRQLRPHRDDKHTSLTELEQYAGRLGLFASLECGGSARLIKEFIVEGIPVMLKVGLDPPDDDWMCHYIIVVGYSDKKSEFILMDSLYGSYYPYSYAKTAEFWAHFMWTYLVIAPKEKQQQISRIIEKHTDSKDSTSLLQHRVYRAVVDNPASAFAWYNLAKLFLLKEQHSSALTALKTAYDLGLPWRLPWYDSAMYEIYLQNALYNEILRLTSRVLSRNPYSEEARYYRAQALLHRGKKHDAFAELNKALEVNPFFEPALTLLNRIKALP
jgi:tetratricopeptide (TPR) repeat protein